MQEWLNLVTRIVIQAIDLLALAVLVIGTIEAAFYSARGLFTPSITNAQIRQIWLRYARWLVAALTFQLAADIAESAIAPGWQDIGRLAAIAVIRTFLDYFLERDVTEARHRIGSALGAKPPVGPPDGPGSSPPDP